MKTKKTLHYKNIDVVVPQPKVGQKHIGGVCSRKLQQTNGWEIEKVIK